MTKECFDSENQPINETEHICASNGTKKDEQGTDAGALACYKTLNSKNSKNSKRNSFVSNFLKPAQMMMVSSKALLLTEPD